MFNEDLEEIKKRQSIMNTTINEIKSTLEVTSSRITEAENRINEVEDRVVKITVLIWGTNQSLCLQLRLGKGEE